MTESPSATPFTLIYGFCLFYKRKNCKTFFKSVAFYFESITGTLLRCVYSLTLREEALRPGYRSSSLYGMDLTAARTGGHG